MVFELGKEFDEYTLDGRELKSVMTLQDNKLTLDQSGEPKCSMTLEFGETEMVATMRANNVVCIRKYRVEDD